MSTCVACQCRLRPDESEHCEDCKRGADAILKYAVLQNALEDWWSRAIIPPVEHRHLCVYCGEEWGPCLCYGDEREPALCATHSPEEEEMER